MSTIDSLVEALNALLNEQNSEVDKYLEILEKIQTDFKLRFVLIDLDKFNEEKMSEYNLKKLEAANARDFESAALYRTMEDECREYIDLKESLEVTTSRFVNEDGLLFCFFFGNSQAEKVAKDAIASLTRKIVSDGTS